MTDSRLLNLPCELRLMIWRLVLRQHRCGLLTSVIVRKRLNEISSNFLHRSDILRVSRRITDEAIEMLYQANRFRLLPIHLLNGIVAKNVSFVRHVSLSLSYRLLTTTPYDGFPIFDETRKCHPKDG